jgi:hypothetical protein
MVIIGVPPALTYHWGLHGTGTFSAMPVQPLSRMQNAERQTPKFRAVRIYSGRTISETSVKRSAENAERGTRNATPPNFELSGFIREEQFRKPALSVQPRMQNAERGTRNAKPRISSCPDLFGKNNFGNQP